MIYWYILSILNHYYINYIYNDLVDIIYPVGSIYLSYNNTNPEDIFEGTTWEAYGTDTQYLRLGGNGTGGSSTSGSTTLTAAQIPAHTHTGPSHTHTQQGTFTSGTESMTLSHNHAISTSSGTLLDKITVTSNGAHTHKIKVTSAAVAAGTKYARLDTSSSTYSATLTNSTGAHSHTISGNSGYGAPSTHTHSTTISGNTGASGTGNTGSTGGSTGHTHTVTPEYIQVYAWKRTA